MKIFNNHIFTFLKIILIPLLVGNAIIYLIGSFIAMDWDYHNWWIINSTLGRVFICILELVILANISNFWDELIG